MTEQPDNALVPTNGAPEAGLVARQEFGASQLARLPETSSMAVAAQAKAAVEARYVMALQRPRDVDQVRMKLLRECKRPAFCETARYRKPIGGGHLEGFSIRFAEAAFRALTNVLPEITTLYDDAEKRIVRVAVTDLEANLTYSKELVIEKTVERARPRPGSPVRVRKNSLGKDVYLVDATEDEMLSKEAALTSKVIRMLGLRLVPGDILDEALAAIKETIKSGAKADPDKARKNILDAFAGLGITPEQVRHFLGRPSIEVMTEAEVEQLRGLYAALKDGETTWDDVIAERAPVTGQGAGGTAGTAKDSAPEPATAAAKLANKVASRAQVNAGGKAATAEAREEPGADG